MADTKINYTSIKTEKYPAATDLVAVTEGRCAARVTLKAVPGDPTCVYAEFPAPTEGRVTSVSLGLKGVSPSGQVLLTMVSPEVDPIGAFMYTFLEGVMPTTAGPPMYRKTDITAAMYSTAQLSKLGVLCAVIVGGSVPDGTVADIVIVAEGR